MCPPLTPCAHGSKRKGCAQSLSLSLSLRFHFCSLFPYILFLSLSAHMSSLARDTDAGKKTQYVFNLPKAAAPLPPPPQPPPSAEDHGIVNVHQLRLYGNDGSSSSSDEDEEDDDGHLADRYFPPVPDAMDVDEPTTPALVRIISGLASPILVDKINPRIQMLFLLALNAQANALPRTQFMASINTSKGMRGTFVPSALKTAEDVQHRLRDLTPANVAYAHDAYVSNLLDGVDDTSSRRAEYSARRYHTVGAVMPAATKGILEMPDKIVEWTFVSLLPVLENGVPHDPYELFVVVEQIPLESTAASEAAAILEPLDGKKKKKKKTPKSNSKKKKVTAAETAVVPVAEVEVQGTKRARPEEEEEGEAAAAAEEIIAAVESPKKKPRRAEKTAVVVIENPAWVAAQEVHDPMVGVEESVIPQQASIPSPMRVSLIPVDGHENWRVFPSQILVQLQGLSRTFFEANHFRAVGMDIVKDIDGKSWGKDTPFPSIDSIWEVLKARHDYRGQFPHEFLFPNHQNTKKLFLMAQHFFRLFLIPASNVESPLATAEYDLDLAQTLWDATAIPELAHKVRGSNPLAGWDALAADEESEFDVLKECETLPKPISRVPVGLPVVPRKILVVPSLRVLPDIFHALVSAPAWPEKISKHVDEVRKEFAARIYDLSTVQSERDIVLLMDSIFTALMGKLWPNAPPVCAFFYSPFRFFFFSFLLLETI